MQEFLDLSRWRLAGIDEVISGEYICITKLRNGVKDVVCDVAYTSFKPSGLTPLEEMEWIVSREFYVPILPASNPGDILLMTTKVGVQGYVIALQGGLWQVVWPTSRQTGTLGTHELIRQFADASFELVAASFISQQEPAA